MRGGTLKQALIEQFSTGTDRRLFVYLDSQRVDAVENGEVVRTFKVSTGKSKTPTVTGSFYIYDRYRHKTMRSDVGKGQRGEQSPGADPRWQSHLWKVGLDWATPS